MNFDDEPARRAVRAKAIRILTEICFLIERRAKELLSVAGTGKVKGRRSGPVVHSAPGEPPRKQTGRLRASVTHEIDETSLTARVGTNVEYGRHLELGTKRGIRPRPWLRPAVAEVMAEIESLLATLRGF